MINWVATLSNGETITEGKGIATKVKGEDSPYLKLKEYIKNKKLTIISIGLLCEDGRHYYLTEIDRNGKNTLKGFNYFRHVITEFGGTDPEGEPKKEPLERETTRYKGGGTDMPLEDLLDELKKSKGITGVNYENITPEEVLRNAKRQLRGGAEGDFQHICIEATYKDYTLQVWADENDPYKIWIEVLNGK